MTLGPWAQVLIMGIGALVVVIAVMITACFVGPGCWGFEYLQAVERRRRNSKDLQLLENGGKGRITLTKLGPSSWLGAGAPIMNPGLITNEKSYQATGTDLNVSCAPYFIPAAVKASLLNPIPATLLVNLCCVNASQDGKTTKLQGTILEARNLPRRQYVSTLEPFLTVEVLNNKWSLQKTQKTFHKTQSRVVRHTHHPRFNHTFSVDHVTSAQLKEWCLKITIHDQDKLTRTTAVCEARLHLRNVPALSGSQPVTMDLPLLPVEQDKSAKDLGEILLGLCYFPTAQKLCVTIVKAAKLKFLNIVQDVGEFYPYVRVLMLSSQGKLLKKRKTCFKHADPNPAYNEALSFELPAVQLEQVAFIVSVSSRSIGKMSSSDGSNLEDTESEMSGTQPRDRVLGSVVIGRNVTGQVPRDHWMTMLMNPRKVLSVWHQLT